MSEENVEAVRAFYRNRRRATDTGDTSEFFERFAASLDEAIEFDASASRLLPGYRDLIRGRDAVTDYYRQWFGTWWEDVVVEPIEIRAIDDDRVLITDRQRGRGMGSGAPFDIQISGILTFRAGRVLRMEFFDSREEALEAAGLSE